MPRHTQDQALRIRNNLSKKLNKVFLYLVMNLENSYIKEKTKVKKKVGIKNVLAEVFPQQKAEM